MKTIDLGTNPIDVQDLLDQAGREDVLVRSADGREFLVVAVEDFDLEITRTRQNEKLMAFLEGRAGQAEAVPLEEVRRRLGLED